MRALCDLCIVIPCDNMQIIEDLHLCIAHSLFTCVRSKISHADRAIQAVDPKTGERRWEFRMSDVTDSGVLSTATDLVFAGGREGHFFALDAKTGSLLWKSTVGGQVASGPMTYAVNGKQYVAVSAGNNLFVFALRQ